MTTPNIRPATPADVSAVAALIATAFQPLAAVCWMVPEPEQRLQVFTDNFAIVVTHAVHHGQVWIAGDTTAGAVWLPGGPQMQAPDDYDRRLTQATGPWVERFRTLDRLMADHHPIAPHEYLALLAVHPAHQNRGLGSALLRHTHTMLDRHATPAYLEASDTRSRDLYLRHGYQPRAPFHLPDGTPFFPMWRPARPPQPDAVTRAVPRARTSPGPAPGAT